METLLKIVQTVNMYLSDYVLVILLIGAGLYFTIRTKSFSLKPMSPEEAILQMNLLGHSFFVFTDSETEETCVVYRRRDGNYGMIVPSKD